MGTIEIVTFSDSSEKAFLEVPVCTLTPTSVFVVKGETTNVEAVLGWI